MQGFKHDMISRIGRSGFLTGVARFPYEQLAVVEITGVESLGIERDGDFAVARFRQHNAFVNTGLDHALDRQMGTNGPPAAISHMGVTSDATAVTASTTTLGGTPTIVAVSNKVEASSQTASADGTFTEANADFAHKKVGFLNTATDAGTGLINVIGGAGTSPYDEPFTVDLSSADTFSVTYTLSLVASAV